MSISKTEMEMIVLLLGRADSEQRRAIKESLKDGVNGSIARPFNIGDRVIFKPRKTKPSVIGTIKSMNKETFTIVNCSDNGPGWRIRPESLKHYTTA